MEQNVIRCAIYHLCKVGSVPAGELDSFVLEKVKAAFRSPEIIQELVHQVKKHKDGYGVKEIYDIVQSMDKVFEHFEPVTIQNIINKLIAGVLIKRDQIIIRFKPFGISLLDDNIKVRENGYNAKTLEFTYNVTFARKRGRIKIVEPLTGETPSGVQPIVLEIQPIGTTMGTE